MNKHTSPASQGKRVYLRFDAERAMRQAVKAGDIPYLAMFLYLVMWTRANSVTGNVWGDPSYKELAGESGMSVRTVTRYAKVLISDGWVIVKHPARDDAIRKHETNSYRLAVPPKYATVVELMSDRHRAYVTQTQAPYAMNGNEQVGSYVTQTYGSEMPTSSVRTIKRGSAALNGAAAPGVNFRCRTCGRNAAQCQMAEDCTAMGRERWECLTCGSPRYEMRYIGGRLKVTCDDCTGKPADIPAIDNAAITCRSCNRTALECADGTGCKDYDPYCSRCGGEDRNVWLQFSYEGKAFVSCQNCDTDAVSQFEQAQEAEKQRRKYAYMSAQAS